MIATKRLILRDWRDADRAPFAEMGSDAEVMRHLGPLLTRAASDVVVDRLTATQAGHGFTFWAVERAADGCFVGFCGLDPVGLSGTPIDDDVEIGWRLRRDAWGQGYAHEAAAAALAWGFGVRGLKRIVAMTVRANTRSWGLMERLGMARRSDLDFDHPRLDPDDPLRAHIVYALERP